MNRIVAIVLLFSCLLTRCKEKYDPTIKSTSQSSLVIDGNLNPTDTTFIRLSKTVSIDTSIRSNPENGAIVTIEGKDNSTYHLSEQGNGTYILPVSGLGIGKDYRLRVTTSGGKQYLSDYITIKDTPPIDSITWTRNNSGVNININTHDPQNKSVYYRWEYDETYEIHSFYVAQWKYENGTFSPRSPDEKVYICYKSSSSTDIVLGSSAKLQSDIISQVPIIFIPNNSEKLNIRYSVLVKQYVLSKQAYDYLEILKKNTESIGNIFGVLPAEVTGNIHCLSNPNEQVIGFLTGSPVQKQRIFIDVKDLPGWSYKQGCGSIYVVNNPDSLKPFITSYMVYNANEAGIVILGYYFSDPICVDCRTRGGSLTKPSFW